MRLLPALLIITAIASLGYALVTVVAPGFMRDLSAAPSEDAWLRYQVPLYIGLAVISLAAARDVVPTPGVVWGIASVWGGLFAVLIINLARGDEPWSALVVIRLVFDPAMAIALAGAQLVRRESLPARQRLERSAIRTSVHISAFRPSKTAAIGGSPDASAIRVLIRVQSGRGENEEGPI